MTIAMGLVLIGLVADRASAGGVCGLALSERAHWDQDPGQYADVWADGNVAFLGQFFDNKVHFFDISNPDNPTRFLEWVVGAPNQSASAQDVKSGDGLLFIALDSDSNDGVEIVDIRDPFNPQHLTWVDTPGYPDVHNVFYDGGMLYLADSRDPEVAIVDLTGYDPDNPPARIETNLWRFTVGSSFVHDITVRNGRLYVCAWNSGLHVYDVSNVANQQPVFLGSATGSSTHSVWPSGDARWAVVGEERSGGPVKLYEITGGGTSVVLRDTMALPGRAFSVHNPVVIGLRVYVSWYGAGLVILDIDPNAKTLNEVGSYDTFPGVGGFDGAWGVYPFLGEDRILVGDLQTGFYIVNAAPENCNDGLFCNGIESCGLQGCVPGNDPCPGMGCNESTNQCVDCTTHGDCNDGNNCTTDTCQGGMCVATDVECPMGQQCDPDSGQCEDFCLSDGDCPGNLVCNTTLGACVECITDGSCFDGLNCTEDLCSQGSCTFPPVICLSDERCDPADGECKECLNDTHCPPGLTCNTSIGECVGCLDDTPCDDGVWCNGPERCVGGDCQPGPEPCPEQLCDESGQTCADCLNDGHCDDALWCNGAEGCEAGQCQPGDDPCPGQFCNDETDQCVQCLFDYQCNDGLFCNGEELCEAGVCSVGTPPCPIEECIESEGRCIECITDVECPGGDFCAFAFCTEVGTCALEPRRYGDGNRDGTVDLLDVLCVLDGFRGTFESCAYEDLDIADCKSIGDPIDLRDILAVLDAFAGLDRCCGE